jgi:UDP-N-acetylglucosamine 3-dehydrogenase
MVTVAILGAGFMGATHANGFTALGDRARVKTVCSRTSERAAKVAETLGATFTDDLDAVLADPEIDAVDICLPTPLHRETATKAFAAGMHVLLEKPIALTDEDARAILRAAEASGRTFMVGLVVRFFAEYQEIARRVAAGEIGAVQGVSAYRLSFPADWGDWIGDPAQSGGTPIDLMVHDFDQLNLLLGKPRSVFARAARGGEGHVVAVVDHEGGTGLVEGSMIMPTSFPFSAGIRILGEDAVLEHGFRAAPAEDGGNIGADVQSFLRCHPMSGPPETIAVEAVDPWGAEIAYFVDRVESGAAVEEGTGEQALAALRVSLAVNRSLASGMAEAVG